MSLIFFVRRRQRSLAFFGEIAPRRKPAKVLKLDLKTVRALSPHINHFEFKERHNNYLIMCKKEKRP